MKTCILQIDPKGEHHQKEVIRNKGNEHKNIKMLPINIRKI